jgi:lipopolysaccharide transport system ATP-binding protein
MSEIAIKTENLGKRYRLGQFIGYMTLRESLVSVVRAPLRRFSGKQPPSDAGPKGDHIWALRDVSFEIKEGEAVGVIGRNGAGKTTLLRILSRITEPTEGSARIRGRFGTLLEVGTGFHPELTGRENVYLNGAILGMRRKEIASKFDAIIDFAGFEEFVDTPLKRFSSGMQVRLAFSVAAHMQPEILMVDEVLAVGDIEFQRKCLGKMNDVAKGGRTVVFVSHNMTAIRNLCPRTLLIDQGLLLMDTDTETAVNAYLKRNLTEGATITGEELQKRTSGVVIRDSPFIRFREVAVTGAKGAARNSFQSDEAISIAVTYECLQQVNDLRVIVTLTDENGTPLMNSQNADTDEAVEFYKRSAGVYHSVCTIPADTLGEKTYYVTLQLLYIGIEHLVLDKVLSFDVAFKGYYGVRQASFPNAYFRPRLDWRTTRG